MKFNFKVFGMQKGKLGKNSLGIAKIRRKDSSAAHIGSIYAGEGVSQKATLHSPPPSHALSSSPTAAAPRVQLCRRLLPLLPSLGLSSLHRCSDRSHHQHHQSPCSSRAVAEPPLPYLHSASAASAAALAEPSPRAHEPCSFTAPALAISRQFSLGSAYWCPTPVLGIFLSPDLPVQGCLSSSQ